jgi:GNAT superfamily N-acetyltransferase
MSVELRRSDILSEPDRKILFDWGDDIFGANALNLRWRPKDLHFVIYENGRPLSHAGILNHAITIADQPFRVGGLGGVVTVPEAQRKGLARQVVLQATKVLAEEWKVQAGLLFCLPRMIAYYNSMGWNVIDSQVTIDQPTGKIISPLVVMVLPFGDTRWPEGAIDLNSRPW